MYTHLSEQCTQEARTQPCTRYVSAASGLVSPGMLRDVDLQFFARKTAAPWQNRRNHPQHLRLRDRIADFDSVVVITEQAMKRALLPGGAIFPFQEVVEQEWSDFQVNVLHR